MAGFDMFRVGDNGPMWLGVSASFTAAKRHIETLDPGDYLILNGADHRKTEMRVEPSNGFHDRAQVRELLADAMRIANADMGTLQIYTAATKSLELVVQIGFDESFVNHFRTVCAGDAACGTALARGTRVVVDDVKTDPIFSQESRRVMLRNGSRSLQSIPLVNSQNQLVGMVSPHYKTPRCPREQHARLSADIVRMLADRISPQI